MSWIGVDLDGTLAMYEPGAPFNPTVIGDPIWPMVARVHKWLSEGTEVRIVTARVAGPESLAGPVRSAIQAWLERACHLPPLAVTNSKDYAMFQLWDDRAVQVIPNTGRRADGLP